MLSSSLIRKKPQDFLQEEDNQDMENSPRFNMDQGPPIVEDIEFEDDDNEVTVTNFIWHDVWKH